MQHGSAQATVVHDLPRTPVSNSVPLQQPAAREDADCRDGAGRPASPPPNVCACKSTFRVFLKTCLWPWYRSFRRLRARIAHAHAAAACVRVPPRSNAEVPDRIIPFLRLEGTGLNWVGMSLLLPITLAYGAFPVVIRAWRALSAHAVRGGRAQWRS